MHQIAAILFALALLLVSCAPPATSTTQAALSVALAAAHHPSHLVLGMARSATLWPGRV